MPRRHAVRAAAVLLALAAATTASAGSVRIHRGDTLSELAQRYGTTVAALQQANGLSSSRIYAGELLLLPGPGGTQATSGTAQRASGHRALLASRTSVTKAQARSLVAASARRQGVPVELALAVAYQESGFQQHVVSGSDAVGIMQVLPSTGRGLSAQTGRHFDLLDARDNVDAGVLLLSRLLHATGSREGTLAAYYQGLGSLARQGVLAETRAYVTSVGALQQRFG